MVQDRGVRRPIYPFRCVGVFFQTGAGVHPHKMQKTNIGSGYQGVSEIMWETWGFSHFEYDA